MAEAAAGASGPRPNGEASVASDAAAVPQLGMAAQQGVPAMFGRPPAPFPAPAPRLVPAAVTHAKLAAELADWDANAAIYQRRGWILLERGDEHVVVAFIATVPFVGVVTLPVVTACVHLDYSNYDLRPPSVTFIDPRTRQPASPAVRAPGTGHAGLRDALVDGHPLTGRQFLCLPGIREYHDHPQHSGDNWLLHRHTGAGRLAVICERIWQRMVVNVVGLRVTLQALPASIGTQVEVALAQGDLTFGGQPTPGARLPAMPQPGGPT